MRFIPVYTGNTKMTEPDEEDDPVYPCVYREHLINDLPRTKAAGLSLCIQGTL